MARGYTIVLSVEGNNQKQAEWSRKKVVFGIIGITFIAAICGVGGYLLFAYTPSSNGSGSNINQNGPSASNNGIPNPYNNYCGKDYTASTDCHAPCPSGHDSDCPSGQFCYTGLTFCAGSKVPTQTPSGAPSDPSPTSVPVSAAPIPPPPASGAPTRMPTVVIASLKPSKSPASTSGPSRSPVYRPSSAPQPPLVSITPSATPSMRPSTGPIVNRAPSVAPASRSPTSVRSNSYCGTSFSTAMACAVACPSGTNLECPSGQYCYASVGCIGTLAPVSSPSVLPPVAPAVDVGYWMWTWAGAHASPTGTTLSVAFNGWVSVANALRESNLVLPFMVGSTFISFGGGNANVSLILYPFLRFQMWF